ncbi:MAG: bifunctional metallophosphatase/5'-nucleotidase [Desulfobacteraceae bacterium]|nr:bifunctional metallophosphatase/5'-nucleotidase [Desulfobacteraceae bacterium]MBC2757791.1 bifunctional metallophosphatase/5'-nucleotidase [Desulfobacteraceae bacterium]MBC2763849.1 bifunctional metallophosphatase/5'-nucleotidase [ANME-2 cluster archaeon]
MKEIISDFTKILSCLLMITFLGTLILIGPASSAIADDSIEAVIDVNPNTFNLKSKGKWATVYIEFPDTCTTDVGQIDVGSVILNVNGYDILAETRPSGIGDYDHDGVPDLMVKFDRQSLQSRMFMGSEELVISGTADGADFMGSDTVSVKAKGITSTILQTSDIHHHASGAGAYLDYTPDGGENDVVRGGFARMATIIGTVQATQEAAGIDVLTLDSADWYMGTTYDMTVSDPIILRFFQAMGYDATTLGNHEFDWTPDGLALILGNGIGAGFTVPVVATNTIFDDDPAETGDDLLKTLKTAGYIVEKLIINLPNSGLRVGILGLLGPNADQDAPVAPPVTFDHDYPFIQARVDDLRNNDKVDFVVVLSHGGVENDGTGDDADLAENVTGIDIIASGHYHTATQNALIKGDSNTIIFSPGEYGEYVSRLDFTYNEKIGRIVGFDFELMAVDDTVVGDPAMQGMVAYYNGELDTALTPLGVTLATPISSTTFDLTLDSPTPYTGITGLGSLCADSVRNVCNALAPFNFGTLVDVGIVANGVIRDPLLKGNTGVISFTDVYNCLPLGASPYQPSPPGYPIVAAYFLGSEITTLCELSLSVSQAIGNNYYLNLSGLQIDYNPLLWPHGVQAVRVYSPADPLCLGAAGGFPAPVDIVDGNLYHIAVDLYALQMMGVVNAYLPLFGLPPIYPRDAAGNILDLSDGTLVGSLRIDADGTGQELKEWMALLNYLPTLGGVPAGVYDNTAGGAVNGRVLLLW